MNTTDKRAGKTAVSMALVGFALNPISALAQNNSAAQDQVQEKVGQSTKKATKKEALSLSGTGDFFMRAGGSGTKPDVNLNGDVSYSGNHISFGLTSMLDLGYLGDVERSGDFGKVFSESHGYLSIGNLPFRAASELYTISNPQVKGMLAGVATKPIKIGGVMLSTEFYPISNQSEMELSIYVNATLEELRRRLSGSASLLRRLSVYGMDKNFFKKGKDTRFGNAGVKYDIGKGFYLKGEYRNWPVQTSNRGMRRDHSVAIGIGYGGSIKK